MMGGGRESNSSSLMMWSGTADSKNMMSSLMPCAAEEQGGVSTSKMPPLSSSSSSSSMLFQIPSSTGGLLLGPEVNGGAGTAASLASNLRDDVGQESSMPESWSQLLLGELAGDHERYSAATALLSKGLEEGPLPHAAPAAYNFYGGNHGADEIQASKSPAVSQMLLVSPPSSCITSSLRGSNMLQFSNGTAPAPDQLKNHQSDNSSESNSNATGSAPKKARVQTSSSAQSTLKVRKERLGDRVTALHQIVSPFGKTDTASVLQETIGYIRFLLSQIEALSYPYLLGGHVGAAGNVDTSVQQYQQPAGAEEDNGGEANEKDLRSRGLCLVPVSCTSRLADDGGASDFWTPPPPAPLGGTGIIWR